MLLQWSTINLYSLLILPKKVKVTVDFFTLTGQTPTDSV